MIRYKYKALNKRNIWVEGNLHYNVKYHSFQIQMVYTKPPAQSDPRGDGEHSVLMDIDDKTLCIGTGLHSKKNTPVFQYDVLRETYELDNDDIVNYYVVVWVQEEARFTLMTPTQFIIYLEKGWEDIHSDIATTMSEVKDFEVIGNVFDGNKYGYNEDLLLDYMGERKTSEEWYNLVPKECELIITDPDGWDRKNLEYSYNIQKVTKKEFIRRLQRSTSFCKIQITDTNFVE